VLLAVVYFQVTFSLFFWIDRDGLVGTGASQVTETVSMAIDLAELSKMSYSTGFIYYNDNYI
jgi:hypothetical protein